MLSSPKSEKAGFTLLEIMIVLVLISIVLGIGMGAFSKIGSGPSMALGRIKNVVRAARFHAIKEKAPGLVRFDTEKDLVVGLGWKNVGCWHFENNDGGLSSGFPREATLVRAEINPKGVIGSCLDLSFSPDSGPIRAFVPSMSALDSVYGAAVECFVYLNGTGPRTIISKGGSYKIGINEDGCLSGMLGLRRSDSTNNSSDSEYLIDSHPYVLPIQKWIKVGFQFNGYSFSITAGGMVRNREHYPQKMHLVPHHGSPLWFGSQEPGFDGLIDEVRLSAAVLGEEMPFKDTIDLIGPPGLVHFDTKGCLDRDFHTRPVKLEFIHADNKRYRAVIGLMGGVR